MIDDQRVARLRMRIGLLMLGAAVCIGVIGYSIGSDLTQSLAGLAAVGGGILTVGGWLRLGEHG